MILVFTPTIQWGGLDIAFASVSRQTCAEEIIWLVADEHLRFRKHIYSELHERGVVKAVIPFCLPRRKGYSRNLTSSYNEALAYARIMGVDLFVSMQDYIWAPHDGVEKFADIARDYPNALITGLCSIADNPGVEEVVEPQGLFTIFERPFTEKPRESYWWSEVRGQNMPLGVHEINDPIQWELNWAAIPQGLFGMEFDPEYDRGIAYDHQDFAYTCMRERGAKIVLDNTNYAIGLPHKLYFPKMTQENGDLVQVNRERMEARWG